MQKSKYGIFAMVVVAALMASGCHSTSRVGINGVAIWPRAQAEEIQKAGERLGVPVETENMLNLSQAGATLMTATARSWRATPATDLPRGVNYAVAYLDSPGQTFPAGYYTLRAFAEPRGIGTVPARIQVIDAGGRVATEVAGTIDVASLTVPPEAARIAPTIAVFPIPVQNGPSCRWGNKICHCCSNGQLVCTDRLWLPQLATTFTP